MTACPLNPYFWINWSSFVFSLGFKKRTSMVFEASDPWSTIFFISLSVWAVFPSTFTLVTRNRRKNSQFQATALPQYRPKSSCVSFYPYKIIPFIFLSITAPSWLKSRQISSYPRSIYSIFFTVVTPFAASPARTSAAPPEVPALLPLPHAVFLHKFLPLLHQSGYLLPFF